MSPEDTATRRGFLAAAVGGGALLAGCAELGDGGDEPDPISSTRLSEVVGPGGTAAPVVVDSLPVDIERERLRRGVQRVDDLTATLPMPLGPEEIPNGYVRERLADAAADAADRTESARTAGSRLRALEELRRARGRAGYAAAGWGRIEGEADATELRNRAADANLRARSTLAETEYRGEDPVRAARVYAYVERTLERVASDGDSRVNFEAGSVLAVAERGERAESNEAAVADGRYLLDRYRSSLSSPADLSERLSAAASALSKTVDRRHSELPPEPTSTEWDSTKQFRYRLRTDADSSADAVADAERPATTVLSAAGALTDIAAHGRVVERIDGGEAFTVETAAELREIRTTAIEALESALAESRRPELARPMLADAAATVGFADERLSGYSGAVRPRRLDGPVQQYVTATARARSVPAACETVLEELAA